MSLFDGMTRACKYTFLTVFWSMMIFLTGLLLFNALHYYTFSTNYGILPEKQEAFTNWVWTISFYLHMGAGTVCLAVPLILFIRAYFKFNNKWHRVLGKVYVVDVFLFVVPTGMYIYRIKAGDFIADKKMLLVK